MGISHKKYKICRASTIQKSY